MEDTQLQEFLNKIPKLDKEKLVKLYVRTREAKAADKRAFDAREEEFKSIMEKCQSIMLARCDQEKETGFTTEYGTAYTAEVMKVSIADDEAFFGFVKEQGDLDFFERRVSTTHVELYAKGHKGQVPPGLNIFRERVIRVRKATEK